MQRARWCVGCSPGRKASRRAHGRTTTPTCSPPRCRATISCGSTVTMTMGTTMSKHRKWQPRMPHPRRSGNSDHHACSAARRRRQVQRRNKRRRMTGAVGTVSRWGICCTLAPHGQRRRQRVGMHSRQLATAGRRRVAGDGTQATASAAHQPSQKTDERARCTVRNNL